SRRAGPLSLGVRLSDSLATGHRVSYWLIAENDIEDLYVNVWRWGATMPLIHQSNILEPDVEVFGEQMVIAKMDSCIKLADWLELNILTNLPDGSRIKQSGMMTNEPDDGTFHRDDLAENYSVDQEWLLEFISFLRECGGFYTLG
ncbi:MAG: hypothetical protein U0996_21570, partial [Planctomycetaceae bacterium]